MYSIGYLLGICALHSLVVEDERKARQSQLDEANFRVSIDSLTGAMTKYAYVDAETKIDSQIDNGELGPMATVVFDLNDLKKINDTKGHQAGDKYIIDSVKLIKEYFRNIPVYRVGGDEFAIILTGDDYERKEAMLRAFNEKIDDNVERGNIIVISAGSADYDPERDSTIIQVFTRADREMFVRKRSLKERQAKKQ
jgi:diguanylate cyclase (GGDEF)-like protein